MVAFPLVPTYLPSSEGSKEVEKVSSTRKAEFSAGVERQRSRKAYAAQIVHVRERGKNKNLLVAD